MGGLGGRVGRCDVDGDVAEDLFTGGGWRRAAVKRSVEAWSRTGVSRGNHGPHGA